MFWDRLKHFLSRSVSLPIWLLILIAAIGLAAGVSVWLLGPNRRPWLQTLKDKDGQLVGLRMNPQGIPRNVLAELPTPDDNTPLTDTAQIRTLAQQYEMYQSWEMNPHLCFDDGTISYWSNQSRPAWDLELQFLSRRLVLEAAERDRAHIPYPGDLSKWAERVYPLLLKKAQEK